MKTLFVVCPSPTDGTSLYRGMGPLSHLKRTAKTFEESIQLISADNANWAILSGVDGVFMQRPFTDSHIRLAKMCQTNGKPLWIDYDDNLFKVPKDNPTHANYSQEKNMKNVATLLAMADYVSVSTEQLKKDYDVIRDSAKKYPCEVVPNALNELMFRSTQRDQPRNPLILWRGSNTHDRDLMTFKEQIQNAANANMNKTFTFIGDPFWGFMDYMPDNIIKADAVDPIEYFKVIDRIAPQLMIVPLCDHHFNRCKSNIAWMEAAFAGAAALVPDWEEWKVPGAVTYSGKSDFYEKLLDLILDEETCRRRADQSWQYIQENLTLRTVNRKRRSILDRMFEMR
jgi:hypothetical protein